MIESAHCSWRRIPEEKSLLRIHVRRMYQTPQMRRPIWGDDKWTYWVSPLTFRRMTSIVIPIDADSDDPECVLDNPRPAGRVSRKRRNARNRR